MLQLLLSLLYPKPRATFSIIALGLSTVRWVYSQDCKGILNKFEQMNLKGRAGMVMVF